MTAVTVGEPGGAGPPSTGVSHPALAERAHRRVSAAADTARTVVRRLAAAVPTTQPRTDAGEAWAYVPVREALGDAVVEARAAGAAADLLAEHEAGLAATAAVLTLAWQVPRDVAAMLSALAVALPDAATVAADALRSVTGPATPGTGDPAAPDASGDDRSDATTLVVASAEVLIDAGGAAAALDLVQRMSGRARDHLPDLADAIDAAAAAIARALPDEWALPGPVRLAGMPYLLAPLGHLLSGAALVGVATGPEATRPAVVTARRYLYRHLRAITPEGLTERHLTRTVELIDGLRSDTEA
ncbi:MAG: hypothetical protein JWP76_2855 [Dactylosporangium sp.]|jgi:hypothetical protein|nr:hypothetical protein [Dactylosporangium sp.]